MTQTLNGKICLVTGAAGGVGEAVATRFVAMGCRVILVDIAEERLAALTAELGDGARALPLDISHPENIAVGLASLSEDWRAIDILVNNAGILTNNKAMQTEPDEWRKVLSVNLDGAFYLSRAVLPAMRQKGWGRIINMCSLAMKSGGITAGTAYTTSKGALAALTFSLARETAAEGITVNGIAPAHVLTPMVTEQLTQAQRDELLKVIPVRRFCEVSEVAHVVAFLASPESGFITGEIIDINGGLHLD
jgi:3-oxoacyl-[acyl-carrier protein] reductase